MVTVEAMQRIISYLGLTFGVDVTDWFAVERAIDSNSLAHMARVEMNTLAGSILELTNSELIPIFHEKEESPESEKKIISDFLATLLEEELAYYKPDVKRQLKELIPTSVNVWTKEFRILLHLLVLFDEETSKTLRSNLTMPLADYAVRCLYKGFKEKQSMDY